MIREMGILLIILIIIYHTCNIEENNFTFRATPLLNLMVHQSLLDKGHELEIEYATFLVNING